MRPSARSFLLHANIDAFLTADTLAIRYLTGVKMTSGLLLVTKKAYVLFVDSRYTEHAAEHAYKDIRVKDVSAVEAEFKKIETCGFNEEELSVARHARWKKRFKHVTWKKAGDPAAYFRRAKNPEEIRLLKKAESITKKILSEIPGQLKTGMKEKDLAWIIESRARSLGADGMSFEPIVAFGTNTSRPHHRAAEKKLRADDIVQIDIGARYKGYCADMSRVFFRGRVPQKYHDILSALEEAKKLAIKHSIKGASTREIDRVARDVLKKYGVEKYFTHALGHGVGLDVHEGITLSTRAPDEKLLSGEVIAIEPGVYFEGEFGMRVEDMHYVR